MQRNAIPQLGRTKKGAIRKALKAERLTWVWLSAKTTFSPFHLRSVDSGRSDGSPRFWMAVKSAIGDKLEVGK